MRASEWWRCADIAVAIVAVVAGVAAWLLW